jgi:hypothetical protein
MDCLGRMIELMNMQYAAVLGMAAVHLQPLKLIGMPFLHVFLFV